MAFPTTVLPVKAQWYVNGAWADMVRPSGASALFGLDRANVEITGGRPDETRAADPATCDFQVSNNDGRFTPWNPSGTFYGAFGTNTPVRVGVTSDDAWLRFTGPDQGSEGATPAAGARVTAPDSVGLSVTGDLDVRLNADLDTWVPASGVGADLVGKWTGTAGQKSWQLIVQNSGTGGGILGFFWSAAGTIELGALATVPLPVSSGRLSVRATIDVNNGAAGRTVTFYTSTDTNLSTATWTQLGDPVTTAGVTSIFDSTTVVTIGDTATGSQSRVIRGKWYAVQIRNGIAGSVVADVITSGLTAGVSSFSDGTNTWTLTGAVEVEDTDWRFWGEVPAWRPRRDVSGADNYVPVHATGVMRRLGMGSSPIQSPMRRTLGARTDTVAYWPMEDGESATSFGSATRPFGKRMTTAEAVPDFAADEQFLASAPLPRMNGGRVIGGIRPHVATGVLQFQWLMYIPAATLDQTLLTRFNTAGSRWDVRYSDSSSGSLKLQWYDAAGAAVSETAFIAFNVDNRLVWMSLDLTQSGANVTYALSMLEVGDTAGSTTSGTAVGLTLGAAAAVRTGHLGLDADAVYGHMIVNTSIRSIFDVYRQLNAYIGEPAGRRIERLAAEAGVQFTGRGDLDATVEMGAQGLATSLALMREAADTDHGILYEPRDRDGLAFRTRESLSRQPSQVALSYTGHDLSLYEPADDDSGITNVVTVSRGGVGSPVRGSQWTDSVDDGAKGTATVGEYPLTYTVNVNADTDLPDHAAWLLHLGTVNEPRIERAGVELARTSAFTSDTDRALVRGVGPGDLVTFEDLPSTIGTPDDLRQLVQGYTERLSNFGHWLEWSVAPASPYDVAELATTAATTGESRYTSDGTVTTEALDTTETGIDISTPTGPKWTTAAADYPFDIRIDGERITVGGCTGTGAAQTFTPCTRSVNGVVASHVSGVDVELWQPVYWSL